MGILQKIFRKRNSHTRIQLEGWLQTLAIDAEAVADVGGKELPVKTRVKSWRVKQYDVLDLPKHDLNRPWELKNYYDVVFCLEVFEYVYNPMQAIHNLYDILKADGKLYTSFLFIYPHHGPNNWDYLRYTRWGVNKLLKEARFRSCNIYPRYLKSPWLIEQVYLDEKMAGVNNNQGTLHSEQGYLVEAIK